MPEAHRDAPPPVPLEGYVHQHPACRCYRGGELATECFLPVVWTLAHRGYSGGGRLDVWVYPTQADAERTGAELAMECGLDEDAKARRLFAAGRYAEVMQRYEELALHQEHLLRVQAAWLHPAAGLREYHSPGCGEWEFLPAAVAANVRAAKRA